MAKKPKCPICNGDIENKEEAIKHNGRYHHVECYQDTYDAIQRENQDRQELYEYVAKLYDIDFPTGLMLKQIKNYQDEYGYKYKGMYLSLVYFYETLENQVQEETGLGIIPYVYDKAKENYILCKKIEEQASSLDLKNLVTHKRITIKSPKKNIVKTDNKIIDISTL